MSKTTPTHFKHTYSIGLRLHIVGLLPNFGSIDEIRDQRSLRALMTLKPDESTAVGLRMQGNMAQWREQDDPHPEIQLTESQSNTLLSALRLASDERKLPASDEMIALFEALEAFTKPNP
jgi:hypothetical protein